MVCIEFNISCVIKMFNFFGCKIYFVIKRIEENKLKIVKILNFAKQKYFESLKTKWLTILSNKRKIFTSSGKEIHFQIVKSS